jgi:SAM-dependent methyltransferase
MKVKDFSASGEIFNITQCKDCGLRFTNPRPDSEDMERYYRFENYISHTDDEATGWTNQLYRVARQWTLRQKRSWVEGFVPQKGRLLDIGCGTGDFAGTMKKAGWTVDAVEPDNVAKARAESKHGLSVHPESWLEEPQEAYDVVTLWHVLEHVRDLGTRIDQFTRLVRKGGYLFIAVPNSESLDASHYREHWAAWDVPRHLFHFKSTVLRFRIEQAGFGCVEERNLPLDPFYISMLSEKYKRGKDSPIRGLFMGLRFWWKSIKKDRGASSKLYVFRKG